MKVVPPAIERLVREFNKLPGIGSKTSERFVFHLLRRSSNDVESLANSLLHLKETIRTCKRCYTYTEYELCEICSDASRNTGIICVVAEPRDVIAIEKTGEVKGVYHVLGGVINQVEGIGIDQLRIPELLARVSAEQVSEVIIATNPDMEGETTAMYVAKELEPLSIAVTKIARGLPIGGDIEFADELTLGSAIQARQAIKKPPL